MISGNAPGIKRNIHKFFSIRTRLKIVFLSAAFSGGSEVYIGGEGAVGWP